MTFKCWQARATTWLAKRESARATPPRVAHRCNAAPSYSPFINVCVRIYSFNLCRIRTLCDDNECCTERQLNFDTPRIRTSRHCPTSALVKPHDNSEHCYIVGNLGAHGGGATMHGWRHRWSTLRPRLNGSTLSNISARLVTQQQLVLVHRRQAWSTRRRHHRAREARSMVGSAARAEADRHCATTARVPPNNNDEQYYIVVNVGAHDGCSATHWWRDRWSAPRRQTKSTQPFPTSVCVPPNDISKQWYLVGNVATEGDDADMRQRQRRRDATAC
jgi:hypothetical protein